MEELPFAFARQGFGRQVCVCGLNLIKWKRKKNPLYSNPGKAGTGY
jgi:hypothetical protein